MPGSLALRVPEQSKEMVKSKPEVEAQPKETARVRGNRYHHALKGG